MYIGQLSNCICYGPDFVCKVFWCYIEINFCIFAKVLFGKFKEMDASVHLGESDFSELIKAVFSQVVFLEKDNSFLCSVYCHRDGKAKVQAGVIKRFIYL